MRIQLSDHFTFGKLIRFTFPSIVMMLFTSIYGVVDGLFVSNVVGETAFAAINLIIPYCMIFGAVGSLFGAGGSALVAMVKGQGKDARANQIFTMLVVTMTVTGAALAALSQLFLPAVTDWLGATPEMRPICITYARIFLLGLPTLLLQYGFQSYLITAERPQTGLAITVAAGVSNMVLDWLFIAVLGWGVAGAAAATCIGQCIGGLCPFIVFLRGKNLPLRFSKFRFMPAELKKAASNGLADGIANIAMSLVNMVFNFQLMRYLGEYGVSAYGIIMYVNFVFVAVYLGYAMGIAPAISFHYGSRDEGELQSLFAKSMLLVGGASVALTVIALATARGVSGIFAGYDEAFLTVSTRALRLYSLSYFFSGFNIFASTLFSALNNGPVSAVLSGMRLFVFQVACVFLLPLFLGSDGIWLSMVASEAGVLVLSVIVLIRMNPRYHYLPPRIARKTA